MKYAVIDIETTGLSRFKHSISFIGVGLAEDIGEPISKMFIYDVGYDEDVQKFRNLCENLRKRKVSVVWQNGKFDTLFIEQHLGIRLPISEDVML